MADQQHPPTELAYLASVDLAGIPRRMLRYGPEAEERLRKIQALASQLAEDWELVPAGEVDDLLRYVRRVAEVIREAVSSADSLNRDASALLSAELGALLSDFHGHVNARGLLPGQLRSGNPELKTLALSGGPIKPQSPSADPRRVVQLEQQVGVLQTKLARMEEDRASLDLAAAADAARDAKVAAQEARDAAAAAKEAAAISAVTTSGKFYAERAIAHGKAARAWMWATVVAAIIAAGFAILLVSWTMFAEGSHAGTGDAAAVATYVVERFIALATLGALAYWTSRQMSAHEHNAVVNHQKATAMRTFEAFAKEATDPETKRAVVLEASRAIYSVQGTGWGEADARAYQAPLMQVVSMADGVKQVTERKNP